MLINVVVLLFTVENKVTAFKLVQLPKAATPKLET
jgi:hypothetical protein